MNAPFSEAEKRVLLAEIIKTSNVPLETLLFIIRDARIQPNWQEVLFPFGRNLKACSAAYDSLLSNSGGVSGRPNYYQSASTLGRKRAYSPESRPIRPRPVGGDGAATMVTRSASVGAPPKKRGRPTNAELARRQAEANTRGELHRVFKTPGRGSFGGPVTISSLLGPASSPEPPRGRGRPRKGDTPSVKGKNKEDVDSQENGLSSTQYAQLPESRDLAGSTSTQAGSGVITEIMDSMGDTEAVHAETAGI